MNTMFDVLGTVGIILFLSIPFILTFYLVTSVLAVWLGAPFVPARKSAIQAMVALSQAGSGIKVADLGSGDGRVVRAFAAAGAQADGYEIQPLLVCWSRLASYFRGLSGATSFYTRNLFNVDCSDYDVVVVYGFPKMMDRLATKFEDELKPGARVVMLDFDIPRWTADKESEGVYVYAINTPRQSHSTDGHIEAISASA